MEDKRVLLSVKDMDVKFHVRGRVLTAIRNVSLDIYENESIAIVGESGSGKSVFTKTFAGMLDGNGFIDNGTIIFNDEELSDTVVRYNNTARRMIASTLRKLNEYSRLSLGAATWREILELESEKKRKSELNDEESIALDHELTELITARTKAFNLKQTFDSSKEKDLIKQTAAEISSLDKQIKDLEKRKMELLTNRKNQAKADTAYLKQFNHKMEELKKKHATETEQEITAETKKRNEILAKEIYLSTGRFNLKKRRELINGLLEALKEAMKIGANLEDEQERNAIFDTVAFRVKYLDETAEILHGTCVLNLANIRYSKDWRQIRGGKIATVFQDPMTSLNPIITIGKQITSIILKHQDCTEAEARERALKLMKKVGIPNAESRFDDYPFQYSGGMRQRIVIAIALSCQPKILICDEPTTALDVTIQAQILNLLKTLQKEFGYTIVFITHDLGVVANIADRVAVLYAGQIVELGTVDEIFYDPRHPYTWALLSSLPQLAQKDAKLYSITGTPPSLYNKIVGDAFAPRNPHCIKIDTLLEPPMFKVTDTHYAKTWLLDPRAPKVEKPEIIENTREKLIRSFNIGGGEVETE